jgi:poly(hydroxyalkanoate) depolymerase family esterase
MFGFPSPTPTAQHAGRFIPGRFDADYRTLQYKLFVPSSYSGQPMPLVVMLHGCGQTASDFALGTGMNALAEQFQVLVLYPEQTADVHWNRCWNWYDPTHHRRGEGEPALIAGLTQHIAAEYAVDRERVAVAGLSSGAAMAVILGRTYPDLFSAVGCHSGLAHGSATDSAGALQAMRDGADPGMLADTGPLAGVPTIVFHGDADTTVHRQNSTGVVRQSIESLAAHTPGGHAEVRVIEETGESGGRALDRARRRPCLVGREPARQLHRYARAERQQGNAALLPETLAHFTPPSRMSRRPAAIRRKPPLLLPGCGTVTSLSHSVTHPRRTSCCSRS